MTDLLRKVWPCSGLEEGRIPHDDLYPPSEDSCILALTTASLSPENLLKWIHGAAD